MDEADFIPISALQHYLYCPRQCALIHVEQAWADNVFTAQGQALHARVDRPGGGRRRGVRVVTAMPLAHAELGLSGVADLVEFHATPQGERTLPVEFKRGRPKPHRADEVQLCAQALCLESMLGSEIPEGALFYGETHRRTDVVFDAALRALTRATAIATRALIASGRTPRAEYAQRKCGQCSLIDLCQPRLSASHASVHAWLARALKEDD